MPNYFLFPKHALHSPEPFQMVLFYLKYPSLKLSSNYSVFTRLGFFSLPLLFAMIYLCQLISVLKLICGHPQSPTLANEFLEVRDNYQIYNYIFFILNYIPLSEIKH